MPSKPGYLGFACAVRSAFIFDYCYHIYRDLSGIALNSSIVIAYIHSPLVVFN